MRLKLRNSVTLIVALTLVVCLALALDAWPLLRGGWGWRWPYEVPAQPLRLLPGALVAAAYVGLAITWLRRDEDSPDAAWLAGVVVASVAVQLAFLTFHSPAPLSELFRRTVSDSAGGYHPLAITIDDDIHTFLRDYPINNPTYTTHPRVHPPGITVLFWGAGRLFDALPWLGDPLGRALRPDQCHHRLLMANTNGEIASAVLGMSLPLYGGLAALPIYAAARRLYGRAAARRAAALLPLVPSLTMFTPQWNQAQVLIGGLAFVWLLIGLKEERPWLWAASGLLMSFGTLLDLSDLSAVGFLGFYTLAYYVLARRTDDAPARWWKPARVGLIFGLGLASLWLAYQAAYGVSFVDVVRAITSKHFQLDRPYLPWLFLHPWDFALFSGLPIAGLAAWGVLRRDEHGLALALTVLALDLAGVSRGESGRVWMILLPFLLIAAGAGLQRTDPRPRAFALIAGALAVQLIVMVGFVPVVGTELSDPPNPPFVSDSPSARYQTAATFDGRVELLGYDANLAEGGDALDLTLYWRSIARFDHAYFFGVVIVSSDGTPLGVFDWLPVEGGYPTTCWRPGEVIADRVRIPLEAAPSGEWWISLAAYDPDSGQRLPVTSPGAPPDTQVGLGPIVVP
jgi:hypothetical protein